MTFRVVCKVQKVSINCLIEWTQGPRRRTKAFLAFLAFHLESNVCLLTIESLEGQESTKQCGQLDDQKTFYYRRIIIIFIPFLAKKNKGSFDGLIFYSLLSGLFCSKAEMSAISSHFLTPQWGAKVESAS